MPVRDSATSGWRFGVSEERGARVARRVDTEEVQAAEVGRNFIGVLNPMQSVVPSSVHQTVVAVWDTTPD